MLGSNIGTFCMESLDVRHKQTETPWFIKPSVATADRSSSKPLYLCQVKRCDKLGISGTNPVYWESNDSPLIRAAIELKFYRSFHALIRHKRLQNQYNLNSTGSQYQNEMLWRPITNHRNINLFLPWFLKLLSLPFTSMNSLRRTYMYKG